MATETNAERLARIKKSFGKMVIWLGRRNGKTQISDDIYFIFEQAERAQELEKAIETSKINLLATADNERMNANALRDANAHLREALEFYAHPNNYQLWEEYNGDPRTNEYTNSVSYDGGERACKALKGLI